MPPAKWRPFCLGLKYGYRGNNDLSWIRANGIHAKALSEENLEHLDVIFKMHFKFSFSNWYLDNFSVAYDSSSM